MNLKKMSFLIQKIQMLGFFMIFLEILIFLKIVKLEVKNNELILEKKGVDNEEKNFL